jgi:hypothetical protein
MSLTARRRLALPHETWPNMRAAAEERYWDAMTLAVSGSGRATGAVYLFGYVAEILLKTAYCQLVQLPQTDNVYRFLSSRSSTLHDLSSLERLLQRTRSTIDNPMTPEIAAGLDYRVKIIESHREVSMRYYAFTATSGELGEVYESVEWIRTNYDRLWR